MAESKTAIYILKILDRQERFKGDLNFVQEYALDWLMANEINEQAELELYKVLANALGANQHTSPDFIKKLIEGTKTEEVHETDSEWMTPENVQEIEAMFRGLS